MSLEEEKKEEKSEISNEISYSDKDIKSTKKKNFIGNFFYNLVHSVSSLLNTIVIILFILSISSRILSPNILLFPAFLGLIFPFLLGAMLLFVIYRLVRGSWKALFFNVLILAFSWFVIKSYIPINSPSENIPKDAIKILSLNCRRSSFKGHTEDSPHPILKYIKDTDADLVCLQEVLINKENKNKFLDRKIKDYLLKYSFYSVALAQHTKGSGLVLLSKYPIEKQRVLRLPSLYNGGIVYSLGIKGKEVLLYNLHLESFKIKESDKKAYKSLLKKGSLLQLFHSLVDKFSPAYKIRIEQADKIYLDYSREKSKYIIVAGDFNDPPISYSYRRISNHLEDAFVSSGCGLGYSYKLSFMGIRIDHILHSSKIKSYNCFVDKSIKISDHNPIISYLLLED